MPPLYVPILKGKAGEYGALEDLDDGLRSQIMPLIEIPAVDWDWENERPVKSVDEHVATVAEKIQRAWGVQPVFVEAGGLDEAGTLGDGQTATQFILGGCRRAAMNVVPVVSPESPRRVREDVREHHRRSQSGVALRLTARDFDDENLEDALNQLVESCSVQRGQTDVIVDLQDIGDDSSRAILLVRLVKSALPWREEWRNLIVAASSFPQDLSNVSAASVTQLPRTEWEVWMRIAQRPDYYLRRNVVFGDYAVAHPEPKELDPRVMRMSASIRYTTSDGWLILKGRNVRQWGYEQWYELCENLVERPEYCGADFSAGDQLIAACARRETGTGNATTWRRVATNHHLTLVTRQLANRADF
jgi:hypothetical protein